MALNGVPSLSNDKAYIRELEKIIERLVIDVKDAKTTAMQAQRNSR